MTTREERGSALVIALAVTTAVGLWIAATLSFTDTSLKLGNSVRAQRGSLYAADGAVEKAIQHIRGDVSQGTDGDADCGLPAPVLTLNNRMMHVSCAGQPGSGVISVGGSSPTLGILTLATGAEVGFQQDSNAVVRVDGGVYSHSSITFAGANARLNACPPDFPATQPACAPPPSAKGKVTAHGACDVTRIVAVELNCPNGTPYVAGVDPNYPPASSSFAVVTPPPTRATACPTGTNAVVAFEPGRYQNAAALTALMNKGALSCSKTLFWFKPGVYYFDFPAASPVWTINDKDVTVVGGEPTWGTLPAVPSDVPIPGSCNPDPDVPHPGVQFIFGGPSRLDIQAGKMELCAARGGDADQQIALYGVKTSTGSLSAGSGCIVATPYTGPTASQCPLVRTDGAQTGFVVHGTVYTPAAALDIGLTNIGYQVVSRGILARVLKLKVTPSTGFLGAVISSPGLGSVTTADRRVLLTACEGGPCAVSNARLRSVVKIHDYDSGGNPSPGESTKVESWSVVR